MPTYVFTNYVLLQARRLWGGRGAMPPRFLFLSPHPRFFILLPHGIFLEEEVVLGGKNVKICDFGQRKPSDFGEDLFFFFLRSPPFGRKICDFGQNKPAHFGENLCPSDFNFAPRSRKASNAPVMLFDNVTLARASDGAFRSLSYAATCCLPHYVGFSPSLLQLNIKQGSCK